LDAEPGRPYKLAVFSAEGRDGEYVACVRGLWALNVVLIKDSE